MSRFSRFSIATLLFAGLTIAAQPAQAQFLSNLTVQIEGLRSTEGQLCIKIFTGSQGFPNEDDNAYLKDCFAIEENAMSLTFEELPAGSYAVAVYHDEDEDERFDRSDFGLPREGYGFSNDAPAVTGPPDFGDAVFILPPNDDTIVINVSYPEFP